MKNIVIFGMKNCGKSTLAREITTTCHMKVIVIDHEIEILHQSKSGQQATFREIYKQYGKAYFQALEEQVIKNLAAAHRTNSIIDCSGSAPLNETNRQLLKTIGTTVYRTLARKNPNL